MTMTTTARTISRPRHPRLLTLLATGALLCAGSSALAQAPQATVRGQGTSSGGNAATGSRPPRVDNVDKAKTLLHYAVGIGVIALCVGVVVVPGRRDHDE